MERTLSLTTLTLGLALALSACGAADGADEPLLLDADGASLEAGATDALELGSLEQALSRGSAGGGSAGYTCSGLRCTCTGDADCDDMFGDGVCGDIASCDTTDPLNPVCECLILRVKRPVKSIVLAPTVLEAAR